MKDQLDPKLSVIICFKDWGLDRLVGVTRSIFSSELGDNVEVIISDYGSSNSEGYDRRLAELGARYFYYETNGIWSRSKALNLGIKHAKGEFIVTTDADMVFSPSTFPALLELLETNPQASYILQCRDLPQGIVHEDLLSESVDWNDIETRSKLRPRWGMGGLIAFPKAAYIEVRGLDERFEIYGGEDLDLAKRLVRAGYKRIWIQDPRIRMYHVWHPSSRTTANETPEGRAAIALNTKIHQSDFSVVRNIESWDGAPQEASPLVTVAISTYNRADYILESIRSVQAQSFKDWELVVVNDGSTDNTEEILSKIDDSRIRVYNRENAGLAAARNFITSVARGKYIAVHDDDDLMLPNRLRDELSSLKPGMNGSTGAWVNFNNKDGALEYNSGKSFSVESILFNSGVYLHPTLLVEREILKAIPYNETMRSGSDYNLAVRMARAGVKLAHCGKIVMLRRMHDAQITNSHGDLQRVSGRVSGMMGRALMQGFDKKVVREARGTEDVVSVDRPADLKSFLGPFLPDHLIQSRSVTLRTELNHLSPVQKDLISRITADSQIRIDDGKITDGIFEYSSLNLETLHELQAAFGSSNIVTQLNDQSSEQTVKPNGPVVGIGSFENNDDVLNQCAKRLSRGIYALFEIEGRSNVSFTKFDAPKLKVSFEDSTVSAMWFFFGVAEVDVLEELSPSIVSKFEQLGDSGVKLAFIQKD